MLAMTAQREAALTEINISGIGDEMKYNRIPAFIYTNPEVACVGMTEKELNNSEIKYKSKKLPMTFAGRFVVENEAFNGLCKLFISENDEILGAHILGSPRSEERRVGKECRLYCSSRCSRQSYTTTLLISP